jgi:hypothetical protein
MLTDQETHDLLHGAAETIDVPDRVVTPPSHRTWPPLVAAAAAVALVAVGVGVAVRPDGSAPPPGGDVSSNATTAPAVDPFPGDPSFHLGPDQVPSVEGLSADAAQEKLRAAGFQVEVRDVSSCEAGRAMGTDPGLGALVETGSRLTVLRGDSTTLDCARPPDFGLLDFLTGTGAAPTFANEVRIYQDHNDAQVISGDDAADPASWPETDVISRLLDTVGYDAGAFHPVSISVGDDPDDFSCGDAEPVGLPAVGEAFILVPWRTGPTPVRGPCVDLGIYRNDAGEIAAVQVDARDNFRTPPWAFPPGVLGNSESYARARLEAVGYHGEFVDITDCAPVGIVSRMAGSIDFYPGDTVTLGVTTETGACVSDDWTTAAP